MQTEEAYSKAGQPINKMSQPMSGNLPSEREPWLQFKQGGLEEGDW